jgi:hypothetical protein
MAGLFGNFPVPTMLAQPADLAAWTGTAAPANATALLREATSMVLSATLGGYYAVDTTTGLATDPVVAKVLNDATCIQAAAWAALGIDPNLGGVIVAGVASQKSIGSAHLSYADASAAAAAKEAALNGLVPAAMRKLAQNNLLPSNVWLYG